MGRTFRKTLRRWLCQSYVATWLRKFKKRTYVISYPKCGRTWVATVLMHYVGRVKGHIDEPQEFLFDPGRFNPELFQLNQKVVFTHDIANKSRTPEELKSKFSIKMYAGNRIAFLVRDPRDVLVSYYHHLCKRRDKKGLLEGIKIGEFVRMPKFGLAKLITFYNILPRHIQKTIIFGVFDMKI